MNKYQTLAANTMWISIGTFGSKILVFLMIRFYTDYLTPAEYGVADLMTQTANFLLPLVSVNITEGVFRFAAGRQKEKEDVFSIGLRTITCGSVVLLLLVLCLQNISEIRTYGVLLSSFVIVSCYHALCAHFVRASGNTGLFAVQGLLNTALFVGGNVLFLAVFRWGISGYILSGTAANFLTTVGLIWKAKLWRNVRFLPDRSCQREMLRYCIPLLPNTIFWWGMSVSDRYMIQFFLGSNANGLYAVSYKIPSILTIFASIVISAWQLSAIIESHNGQETQIRFYGSVWKTFVSAICLSASGIIAMAQTLIRILAEESYFSAWHYIPVLTLAVAAAACSDFMGSVYVVKKNSIASFWTSLIGMVGNVGLNRLLIPPFGLQGAAIATLLSCLVVFFLRTMHIRQMLPFPLSGKKGCLGIGILCFQTGYLLFQWTGWFTVQWIGFAMLLWLGIPSVRSVVKVIIDRKQGSV